MGFACALMQALYFEREYVNTALELGDANLQFVLLYPFRLLEKILDSDTCHLGNASETLPKAELAALIVLIFCETEAYHSTARLNSHWQ